jgi:hypothetical protein
MCTQGLSSWNQTVSDFQIGTTDNTIIANDNLTLKINNESKGNWIKLNEKSPSRIVSSMVYDKNKRLGVLFGGIDYNGLCNDTWTYDIYQNQWNNISPSKSPSPRYHFAMVYDNIDDLIILFGGMESTNYPFYWVNDTWTYNLTSNQWVNMSPQEAPPVGYYVMTYDIIDAVCVAFGGGSLDYYSTIPSTTWTYSVTTNKWTKHDTNITPFSRIASAMTYDEANNVMMLFGGFRDDGMGGKDFNDTWILNPENFTWTQKSPMISPPARPGHAMVYDSYKKATILFGGNHGPNGADTDFRDTWYYNSTNNTWVQLYPANTPHQREFHQMFYDSSANSIILTGGYDGVPGNYPFNDTWCYNLNGFFQDGTYTSQPKDTNGRAFFGSLEWNASVSNDTSIEFQLRTANTLEDLQNRSFLGPDGTNSTFYNRSGERIASIHNDSRWIQVKAFLNSNSPLQTPSLSDINIHYNLIQNLSITSPLDSDNWTAIQNITWSSYDDDNDSLNFDIYLVNGLAVSLLTGNLSNDIREWQWNTNSIPNGTYRIKIVSRDDNPSIPLTVNTTSGNFTIYHPPPPNHLPHVDLLSPPNNSIINNTSVRLSWKGIDLDGDLLAYIVRYSDNPQMQGAFSSNSTTEPSMNLVYPTDNKTYYWTVDATDGKSNGTDIPTAVWSITIKINHLPKITSKPPLYIQVGESYEYNITAVDEDNDTMIFSIIQAPNSLSLNSSSGWIHWTPNATEVGNHTIIFRASDGKGGIDQQTFNVSVIPKPPPEKPRCVITYPTNGSKIGGMVTVRGTAVNGSSPLSLIQVRIDGGNWKNAVGLKNWSISVDMGKMNNGKHKIEARAYDGNLYSDTAFVSYSVYNPEPLISVEGGLGWIIIFVVLAAIGVSLVIVRQVQGKRPPKGE